MFTDNIVLDVVVVSVLVSQVLIFLYIQRVNREAVLSRNAIKRSLEKSIDETKRDISRRIQEFYSRTKRDHIDTYRQIVSASDIEDMLGTGLTRNLRGWAISPDALMVVLNYIREYKPSTVLEIGSGYSTVALDRLIKKHSLDVQVVTVDHDSEYLEQTKSLVGDTDNVTFVHAPLRPYDKEGYSWYDSAPIKRALKGSKADLIIVDGPPETTNRYARRPVLDSLRGCVSKEFTIMLDDSARADEKSAVEHWLEQNKSLKHSYIFAEKGLSVLSSVDGVSRHKLL